MKLNLKNLAYFVSGAVMIAAPIALIKSSHYSPRSESSEKNKVQRRAQSNDRDIFEKCDELSRQGQGRRHNRCRSRARRSPAQCPARSAHHSQQPPCLCGAVVPVCRGGTGDLRAGGEEATAGLKPSPPRGGLRPQILASCAPRG